MPMPRVMHHRPLLLAAGGIGSVAGLMLRGFADTSLPHALLGGWCAATGFWLMLAVPLLLRQPAAELRRRAETLDEGQWTVLAAAIGAALASLAAVVWALTRGSGEARGMTIGLGLLTIALSWLFLHVLFAVHYAHEHWLRGKGIAFPGGEEPNFLEFLYFAFTVGMTFQVSDTATETPAIRRLVLVHAVVAFLFNAVILAAAVNLAAAMAG